MQCAINLVALLARVGAKEQLLQSRKIYDILTRAMVDVTFRESLFRDGGEMVKEWMLTNEERAYLDRLPYDAFERMVGRIISHWLIPMPVNNRYMIFPDSAGEIPSNGSIPIRLMESLVFGNGAHATTALCLAAVDDYLLPGSTVLDIGTGSGILSIAAGLGGASSVLALDIDPGSVATARVNIKLNAVEGIIAVEPGSLEQALQAGEGSGRFDLVLVNILTPVILSFLQTGLAEVLKPGAILVASGIESREVPIIKRATLAAGLNEVAITETQGWAAVVTRKPSVPN